LLRALVHYNKCSLIRQHIK